MSTKASSNYSWLRVHLLRKLLEKRGWESVVCIPGIDSFYDTAAFNFVDFLFPSMRSKDSYRRKVEDEDDDVMEDLMFCLNKNTLAIYCNSFNHSKVLFEINGCTRFRIHCLDEDKYSNPDHAEEYKIHCLTYFTKHLNKIAIPYTDASKKEKVSPIEKWPLIQAYAIEDYGRNGFFTLKHEVENCSNVIDILSTELCDSHALHSVLIKKILTSFSLQWENFTATVNAVADNENLLAQINLTETFESFVKHGYAASNADTDSLIDIQQNAMVYPSELFLPSICHQLLPTLRSGGSSARGDVSFQKIFQNQGAIVGFLKSAAPPYLAAARTYFVHTSKANDENHQELVKTVYKSLVEATEYAIEEYVAMEEDSDSKHIRKKVENAFLKMFHTKMAQTIDSDVKTDHVFAIEDFAMDEELNELEFPRLKYVLAAAFVASSSKLGDGFGVLFGDTFLPIKLASCDSGIYKAQAFWLTNSIPRFVNVLDLELQRSIANSNNNQQDGSVMLFGSQMALSAFLPKHLSLFPDAVSINSFKVSISTMDMSIELSNGLHINLDGALDIINVACFEQSSTPDHFDGLYIEINFSVRNRKNAVYPFALAKEPSSSDNNDVIVICVQPRTMPYREFYRLILPAWSTNAAEKTSEKVSHLSKETRHIQRFSSILGAHLKFGNMSSAALPNLFLATNQAVLLLAETQKIAVKKYLPAKRELDYALTGIAVNELVAGNEESIYDVDVFVVCGMPESSTDVLVKDLMAKKTSDTTWLGAFAILPTMESHLHSSAFVVNFKEKTHLADDACFDRFKKFVGEEMKKAALKQPPGKARLIIVSPFFLSLPCLFANFDRRFAEKVTIDDFLCKFTLKTAILCLDGYSDLVVTANRSVNYIAQDHLKPGILSAVVAFCPPGRNRDYVKGHNFDNVRRTIRALNPDVVIYRHSNDIDFEQLPKYWSKEMCLARGQYWSDNERIHYFHESGREKELCFTGSSRAISIVFKPGILQKDKLTANLYFLAKHITGPSHRHEEEADSEPHDWFVWHVAGELTFIDADEPVRLSFTLPQQIFRVAPLRHEASTCFLTFYGENLKEGALRDWLRQSAHSRPTERELLQIEDLGPTFWDKIQTEHRLDPLPEGWFFNGTYYLDATGEKSYRHPRLNEFVSEYVATHNADIERANAETRATKFPDLFN